MMAVRGVLIDTSVWVDHFRHHNGALVALLGLDMALTHPMVVAELACGTPPAPRLQTLGDIGWLQQVQPATLPEVMALIEREKLYGLGCGLVDLLLLASTRITPGGCAVDTGQAAGRAVCASWCAAPACLALTGRD